MRRDVRCVARGVAGLLVVLAVPLAAHETNTWTATAANNAPATALDWTAGENWSLGHAPAAGDDVSVPVNPSGTQFIRLPSSVTVGDLLLKDNALLLGEQVAITSMGNGRTPRVYRGWLFADVTLQAAAGSRSPWIGNNHFCGRILSPHGNVIPADGTVHHRLDRYATSPDPLRTDDLLMGDACRLFPGNAFLAIYAAGAEASASAWAQTAGSPYLALADASAATVAVGAAVTGAGIPAGAYVRRRFTDTHIELSQPATETSASNVLSFAAFHPDARLHVSAYHRQGDNGSELRLLKRLAADGLQLEIDTFGNAGTGQFWQLGLREKDAAEWLPGTLVLHAVTGGHRKGPSDVLRNCHLLFAGTAAGGSTVFGETRIMAFDQAAYTARLTVTNGVGEVANFTNFVGTLVKDGAGTLAIGLADAANAGAIVLEGGTLELTARDTAGTDGVSFAALTMAAGTALKLPEGGLRVAAATFADGATVLGPGTLRVQGIPAGGHVTCRDGAQIVYEPGTEGAYAHQPEAQAAGHPAFWVDASKADSLVCEEEDGVKYVTRWNDWRAGEPMFCTNVVRRPQLVVDAETGAAKYVKISYVSTHWYTNTEGLVWSQPIDGIRAVFLVQDPTDGGGEILGRTSRLGDNRYGTQGGPYYRWEGAGSTGNFISPNYATPCVKFGRFFRNGEEVRGYEAGYLGNFLQLVEHHVNTNYPASGTFRELACDAFGTGGYRDGHEFNNANGRQRIAECLVYTNTLTHAERVQTALYLSRKWLGKDIAYSDVDTEAFADELPRAGEGPVDVAAGRTFGVRRVEGGAAVEKAGAGRLVVESLAAGAVTVRGGELRVKSLSLANTSVPPDAWVHVDAADASTLELAADGRSVAQWRSVAGDGQSYRPLAGSPTRVADALNGLPVVDCGTLNGADKASLRLYTPAGEPVEHNNDGAQNFIPGAPRYKSVFIVYGSQGGGNSLLGCYGNGYPWQGLTHCPSAAGLPVFTATTDKGHTAWDPGLVKSFSNGTYTARLNGAPFDPFTTPFSGAFDQITVSGDFSRKSDTLATFGQGHQHVGGLSYGEVLVYSNQLDAATLPKVEAYLRKKWFDADTAGFRRAACAALHVAAGARVAVDDWAAARGGAAYEAGAGVLTTAALGGGGVVACGRLELAEAGVFTATAEAGKVHALTVEGTLALSRAATLIVTDDVALLPVGRHVLAACGALEGTAKEWTVQAPATPHRAYALRCEAGELALVVSNAGSVLIFR